MLILLLEEDIVEVIVGWIGILLIKINEIEFEKFFSLEDILYERVIG